MTAFICNGMLGTLCTLLRMCGIDTAYSNQGTAILVKARQENRTILTRNTHYKDKDNVYFLTSPHPLEQLLDVIQQYRLKDEIHLFSRCLECNVLLQPVEKLAVQDRVPYYTYTHFDEFSECPQCLKVFWKGSHYRKMINDIGGVLDKTNSSESKE